MCRRVSLEEIEKFAQYNNLMFVGETSAKEDINIKETFESLLKTVHSEQRHVGKLKREAALKLGQRTIHETQGSRSSQCCS